MSNTDPTIKSVSPIDGGEEIVIDVPTPAADVHPDTPVVPADSPDSTPVPAGTLAGDVPVVTPPTPADSTPVASSQPTTPDANDPNAPVPTQPQPSAVDVQPEPVGVTPSGHPADTPTTTAGEAAGNIVIRPDDPNATPTPAVDLPPSTVVFDPSVELTPADPGDVTAAELGAVVKNDSGEALTSDQWQPLIDALDRAGFKIVRK